MCTTRADYCLSARVAKPLNRACVRACAPQSLPPEALSVALLCSSSPLRVSPRVLNGDRAQIFFQLSGACSWCRPRACVGLHFEMLLTCASLQCILMAYIVMTY